MAQKLRPRRTAYATAYDCPGAPRTTNAVDRLMNFQDRWLYARRYLHGKRGTSRLAVRAYRLALELSSVQRQSATARRDPTVALRRLERLPVPRQLVPQLTHCRFFRRLPHLTHKIRWD